jgi:hypothetical protein
MGVLVAATEGSTATGTREEAVTVRAVAGAIGGTAGMEGTIELVTRGKAGEATMGPIAEAAMSIESTAGVAGVVDVATIKGTPDTVAAGVVMVATTQGAAASVAGVGCAAMTSDDDGRIRDAEESEARLEEVRSTISWSTRRCLLALNFFDSVS